MLWPRLVTRPPWPGEFAAASAVVAAVAVAAVTAVAAVVEGILGERWFDAASTWKPGPWFPRLAGLDSWRG